MYSKMDQNEMHQRNLNCDKLKSSFSIHACDDSGYSSDSSASSLKIKQQNVSTKSFSDFPTPDVNWKMKLRNSSTPHTSVKGEVKCIETPFVTPIEGPLLRSKTYPSVSSPSLPLFNLSLSLDAPHSPKKQSSQTQKTSPTWKSSSSLNLSLNLKSPNLKSSPDWNSSPNLKSSPTLRSSTRKEKLKDKLGEKSSFLLRSPLKSPFKLIKKQKSAENISSSDDPFSNPEIKQRTVKALFGDKDEASCTTPIRRMSPRFSNIFTRLMDSAEYILPNIFELLSDRDVVIVSQVCRQLRVVVHNSTPLSTRKKLFLEKSRLELERLGKENTQNKSVASACGSIFNISSPRKHLQQLQNSHSSPQKTPVKIITRFERFVMEGKKLLPGETQQKCVQCQNPARLSPSESKAVCTSEFCAFVYCTRCLLPFHDRPSDCLSLKPKTKVSTASKILSKACKKRLRRL